MNNGLDLEHSRFQALSQMESYNVLREFNMLKEENQRLKCELSQLVDKDS